MIKPVHSESRERSRPSTCRRGHRAMWLACALLASSACASGGALITPRGETLAAPDRNKPSQWLDLRADATASYHVMHVTTRSQPERFLDQDATWMIMRGRMTLHVSGQAIEVQPGDVIEVPRGTTFWTENRFSSPCSAYIVMTPPFTGEGRENVPEVGQSRVSSWHHMRWIGQ